MPTVGLGLDVAGYARALLAAVEQRLTDAGVELPTRRLVAPGQVGLTAVDCEMLMLGLDRIGVGAAPSLPGGLTTGGGGMCFAPRHATYALQLWRCDTAWSGNGPPPAERVTTTGLGLMREAGLIAQELGETFLACCAATFPAGTVVEVGPVTTLGPEGGLVGIAATISLTVGELI